MTAALVARIQRDRRRHHRFAPARPSSCGRDRGWPRRQPVVHRTSEQRRAVLPHASLAPNGTFLVVEPTAGETVLDNVNPIGKLFYSAGLFLCLPTAKAQGGRYQLGPQVPESTWRRTAHRSRLRLIPSSRRDPVQPRVRSHPRRLSIRNRSLQTEPPAGDPARHGRRLDAGTSRLKTAAINPPRLPHQVAAWPRSGTVAVCARCGQRARGRRGARSGRQHRSDAGR